MSNLSKLESRSTEFVNKRYYKDLEKQFKELEDENMSLKFENDRLRKLLEGNNSALKPNLNSCEQVFNDCIDSKLKRDENFYYKDLPLMLQK